MTNERENYIFEKIELLIELGDVQSKRIDDVDTRLRECERLLAMYQQMFGDVNVAQRIIGDRFDNHAEQIKLVNEKVIDLANTLIKFGEAVIKR